MVDCYDIDVVLNWYDIDAVLNCLCTCRLSRDGARYEDAQVKVPSAAGAAKPELSQIPSLESAGVGQIIVLRAPPTARKSAFPVHRTSIFPQIFFQRKVIWLSLIHI